MQELTYPFDGAYILQKKRSLKRALLQNENLISKKVAIMSGSTIGDIKNILELFLLNSGIKPEFYEGSYGLYYENLVFDDGSLKEFAPDIIYIHTSVHNIDAFPNINESEQEVNELLNSTFARFERMWQAALQFNCPIIQNNFEQLSYRVLGNSDAVLPQGALRFVNMLNAKFADYAKDTPGFYINDIQYLSACIGLDNWYNESVYYAYKYTVNTPYIADLCHNIANIIKSIYGKNKKGLVLDLDNTLWGGVIGDDGAQGIALGKESPEGLAYSEFQEYIKRVSELGVMLHVCSKNEEETALTGFERAESVLKKDDFLCFKANWQPKHLNIQDIAKEINVGADSFVFVDDNPAEREIVKTHINGIAVPEMSAPEHFIKTLDRSGYFEVTSLSQDDKKRTQMYKQNLQRAAAQSEENFADYKQYLLSLDMNAEIKAFSSEHAERITQLINKTNQFNLTTRRYTPEEVSALINDGEHICLYARLADKFGDNGIVSAFIAKIEGDTAQILLWVMSCRTFKRHLEYAVFDEFINKCKKANVKKVKGSFYKSAKNLPVKEFYDSIGFDKTDEKENGNKEYVFEKLADYKNLNEVINVN